MKISNYPALKSLAKHPNEWELEKRFPWKVRVEGYLSYYPLEVSVWFLKHECLFLGYGSEASALREMEVCYCLAVYQVPAFLQGCSFLADVPGEGYSCCVSLFFLPENQKMLLILLKTW